MQPWLSSIGRLCCPPHQPHLLLGCKSGRPVWPSVSLRPPSLAGLPGPPLGCAAGTWLCWELHWWPSTRCSFSCWHAGRRGWEVPLLRSSTGWPAGALLLLVCSDPRSACRLRSYYVAPVSSRCKSMPRLPCTCAIPVPHSRSSCVSSQQHDSRSVIPS